MYRVVVNGKNTYVVEPDGTQSVEGKIGDKPYAMDLLKVGENGFHILRDNRSFNAELVEADPVAKTCTIRVNSNTYQIELKDRYDELLKNLGMDNLASQAVQDIKAPMPGLVIDITTEIGNEVAKGEPILVLEAMKMENVLKSPVDGVISAIHVAKGNAVEKNQVLINFE